MPEMKKYISFRRGTIEQADTIEELCGAVHGNAAIEVFETKSVGFYRRKFEVEKVEKMPPLANERLRAKNKIKINDDEFEDDDEA